ncbi:hypothetical protein [Shewanella sp. OMA3-2]|uniref:hypothetical protein n=1 Tax=Shewanella sp. OMA3-2 TaxID=2908650 RepID=UPI001F3E3255|nr:hypothetical protein [Shewanella sp. OMA3-2]UJF22700.1 hypothetical protein L0B17_04690 [Shewanella sp. OMA3-2]
MLLQCAFCHKGFSVASVTQSRGKGLGSHIQCPKCGAWLGRNKWLTSAKVIGFYSAVAAGVAGYFLDNVMHIVTPTIILSVILVGITHIMDHLILIEAPEEPAQNIKAD